MTTIADVMGWKPGQLRGIADALAGRRRALMSLQDEVDGGAIPAGWEGVAALAARANHRALRLELNDRVAGVSAAVEAFDTGAEAVRNARDLLSSALDYARVKDFSVDRSNGTVSDNVTSYADEHEAADRKRILDEIVDHVEQALKAANHADTELAQALDRVVTEVDGGAGDLASARDLGIEAGQRDLLPPPRDGRPGDFKAWFEGLTDEEQDAVIADHPEWVGNVDGIPGWARHQANVNLIDDYRSRLQAQLDDAPPKPPLSDPAGLLEWRERYAHLEDKLAGLDAIEELLAAHPNDRQLLLLDITGERNLKAAVAVGDVDTADHVSVFTPGLTSTVGDSLGTYDHRIVQLLDRAGRFEDANADGEPDTFAGVFWLGYEAPQLDETLLDGDRTVASDGLARDGADDLARFYNGLDAMRGEDPHLTALGHSYGSLTTGLALRHPTGVDDVVFSGSPGLGTTDLDDLDVPDGHSFYIEARNDPVGDFARFGTDPSLLDGMRHLSSDGHVHDDGRTTTGVTGHSSYFVDNSTSQLNMSAVLAGEYDQVVDSQRGPGLHERVIEDGKEAYRDTRQWVGDRVDDVREGYDDVRDWTGDRVDDVREGYDDVRDWTGDRVDDVRDAGQDAVEGATEWGEDRLDDVRDAGQDAVEGATEWGEDRLDDLEDAGGWLEDRLGG